MPVITTAIAPDNSLGALTRRVIQNVVDDGDFIRLLFLRCTFPTYPGFSNTYFGVGAPGEVAGYASTSAALRILSDPSSAAQRGFDELAVGQQIILGNDLELQIQLNSSELFDVVYTVGFVGVAPTEATRKARAGGARSFWDISAN